MPSRRAARLHRPIPPSSHPLPSRAASRRPGTAPRASDPRASPSGKPHCPRVALSLRRLSPPASSPAGRSTDWCERDARQVEETDSWRCGRAAREGQDEQDGREGRADRRARPCAAHPRHTRPRARSSAPHPPVHQAVRSGMAEARVGHALRPAVKRPLDSDLDRGHRSERPAHFSPAAAVLASTLAA